MLVPWQLRDEGFEDMSFLFRPRSSNGTANAFILVVRGGQLSQTGYRIILLPMNNFVMDKNLCILKIKIKNDNIVVDVLSLF